MCPSQSASLKNTSPCVSAKKISMAMELMSVFLWALTLRITKEATGNPFNFFFEHCNQNVILFKLIINLAIKYIFYDRMFDEEYVEWENATQKCQELGARLPVLSDKETIKIVKKYLEEAEFEVFEVKKKY